MKIHSSCEIEYFVETHLCKLCVILRSRVYTIYTHKYYTRMHMIISSSIENPTSSRRGRFLVLGELLSLGGK